MLCGTGVGISDSDVDYGNRGRRATSAFFVLPGKARNEKYGVKHTRPRIRKRIKRRYGKTDKRGTGGWIEKIF